MGGDENEVRDAPEAGAPGRTATVLRVRAKIDISDAGLIAKVSNLLGELSHRLDLTTKELAAAIGLETKRIKAIRYAATQRTRYIALAEVRTILRYGRGAAEGMEDDGDCMALMQDCNDVSNAIWDFLESGGLSATEHAFVSHLQVNPREQRQFSDRMAGVYANIRVDRQRRLAIARMDIFPKEARGILCRFRTSRVAAMVGAEQVIGGYIYQSGSTIHALGRPDNASTLRSTILRAAEMSEHHGLDMVGLRLSDSPLDEGPFSSRLYCRRVAGPEMVDVAMPEWEPILKAVTPTKANIDRILPLIPDIATIHDLLKERDDRSPNWGLSLPRGIEAGDESGGK